MVLAKLALYRDSISPRQAVRLTLIKGARAKHMNPIDLTTLKEQLHERLTLPEAESVLLQRSEGGPWYSAPPPYASDCYCNMGIFSVV